MTPEQIKAFGEALAPLAAAAFAFLTSVVTAIITLVRQSQCRRDLRRTQRELDIAHAKLRARDSHRSWQEEMWDRSKPWKETDDVSDSGSGD